MSNPKPVSAFTDNWAYLKTELTWLDRLLMLAVSRQRRDLKDLDEFVQSAEDRVTSHWWKGIIALNQAPGYDNARPPLKTASRSQGYSQQLAARVQASREQGVILALPWLQEQLQLSQFEKNVILLALAPEINQRFGRLYSYLQYQDDEPAWDLPTVDLCLRLLCRNDLEWRRARPLITPDSQLSDLGIVEWINPQETTLLSRHFRLADDVASYLLSEAPDPAMVSRLATASELPSSSTWVQFETPTDSWKTLIVPEAIQAQLQVLCQSYSDSNLTSPIRLLTGLAGTGKTKLARVLAHSLEIPLVSFDLATITSAEIDVLLTDIQRYPPCVLLIRSVQLWLGRNPHLDPVIVQAFLQDRREQSGLTLLATEYLQTIKPSWRHQLDGMIVLPLPDAPARRQLWKLAIPKGVTVDRKIRWPQIAQRLPLTGGDITTVATTALGLAQQTEDATLRLEHLQQSLGLHHPYLAEKIKPVQRRSAKS